MSPSPVLVTNPHAATRRGFVVATHIAVLARQDALLDPLLGRRPVDLWRHQPRVPCLAPILPHQHQRCPLSPWPSIQNAPLGACLPRFHPCPVMAAYDEGLAVDVVEVQREDVVLAAHVHAVVVLVLQQDAVVARVEEEVEEVCCARRL